MKIQMHFYLFEMWEFRQKEKNIEFSIFYLNFRAKTVSKNSIFLDPSKL